MTKPRCKCGRICAYYGPIGGYSVACKVCNTLNAARQRLARAKIAVKKARRNQHYPLDTEAKKV